MNREQFAGLVLDSTDSLYRVARGILRQDMDCEDAVQEAIAQAFANLHALRRDEYAKTWLTRILIHECYKILRSRKRTIAYEELKTQEACEDRTYTELYQALEGLDVKYRLTIVLHYIEGFSVAEIAELMQTTEGTVKSRLHRGRNSLRRMLEQEEELSWN